ncbi:helix-turn-helix domain-containing protein [Catenulispora subtropica]|uniref:Transposase n=1 Tax=Catenulispora subtropica TaxID=450798 RepID=A0ABN2R8H4_9ACTN
MSSAPAPLPESGAAALRPPEAVSQVVLERYRTLAPHLYGGVSLRAAAAAAGAPYRTAQRWLAAWRAGGLPGLARAQRSDKGSRKIPPELVEFIEGLALSKPRPGVTVIHRRAVSVAAQHGWPEPGYWTVHEIVSALDPALLLLAHEGVKRYREVYELVYRREAAAPNEFWQADHTQLDLWVLDDRGRPARAWLTAIEDDHSRAVAGYAVNLDTPSAITTALALSNRRAQ